MLVLKTSFFFLSQIHNQIEPPEPSARTRVGRWSVQFAGPLISDWSRNWARRRRRSFSWRRTGFSRRRSADVGAAALCVCVLTRHRRRLGCLLAKNKQRIRRSGVAKKTACVSRVKRSQCAWNPTKGSQSIFGQVERYGRVGWSDLLVEN